MNNIRDIRNGQGLTQVQLAEMANVSQPYLLDLEKGRRGAKPETWQRIADALNVTVDELRGVDDESSDA